MPLFDLAYAGAPSPGVGALTLREDCTGVSMELTGFARLTNGDAPILYDQGFTIEMAIKPTTVGVRAVGGGTSRMVPGVQSHANANDQSIFQLGFDNWASGGTGLFPTFTILSDNNTYQSLLDHAVILGEARGSTLMVLDNIYHLLGTLDANGLCELYVNGVLEATASPNINMVDFISAGNLDLGNAARTLRDVFDIGTRFLDGAYRGESDAGQATIDNVRFYDRHFSASEAAVAASEIGFTTDTVGDDATAYVLDELSAANPGGAGQARLDMQWRQDGTRVFTCRQSANISQNDVSPAWGIQVGDWTNLVNTVNFGNLRSIWWSADGSRLSRCARVPSFNMNVTVYDQSATPFDLSVLGSSTTKTFPVTPALSGGPADHIWSADGLTLWVQYNAAPRALYEWSVTVAFDITTLIQPQNKSFNLDTDANFAIDTIAFSADGTMLYGMDGQFLVSWDLTTPYDISTATNFQTGPKVESADVGIPRGLDYRADNGDISVEGDQNLGKVAWFRVPTVFQDADQYCLKSDDPTPEPFSASGGFRYDVRFRPDGLRAWTQWTILVGGFDTHQYDVSPAWSTTGWTPSGNILRSSSQNRSFTWHDNGNKLTFLRVWFAGFRRVDTYDMSATPYDISSGLGPVFASLTAITGPGEFLVRFSLDGFKMFTDISATTIQRYNLAVAHDISSSTGVDQSFNYGAAGAGSTNSWDFSSDHTKLYFRTGGSLLASFDLTAPDDISAPFNFVTGVSVNLPTNLGVARGLTIRPDNGDWILLADQNNQRLRVWETR
jgi:hypothetical protein